METDKAECRSIDELSKLGTYQGMTDEEIEKLMAYNARIAVERADAEARAKAIDAQTQAMKEQAQTKAEEAMEAFKHACEAASLVQFEQVNANV